ncbi:SGNH/GDSL hydrolase family protein [Larkinella rosea]|uniref:SGNH/GDSL hydrolase family protein n=1 Tax=Larkinella rosea TaxID=2025312 RepID=A0A3P1BC61_9BACT|nr:SGNH/GDSL hydrolase family protein [Larkinella rosea]RRA98670.1 SGNH/GDSL hydrolase family protein [Larkinella rosea]
MTTTPNANYLALGDSYTIGESVSAADRWCVQLAGLLRKDGLSITDPDIIARTGWTTSELHDAIKKSGNQKTYSLVSLLIGVNNQYRGQSTETYRTEFRDLLQTAVRFAGDKPKRVFVVSTPDWGVTPYAAGRNSQQIAQEIDAFNAIAQEECKKAGILYVDITPISRTAANDPSQIADDQLHFSGKQYRQWAEKALPDVKKLL